MTERFQGFSQGYGNGESGDPPDDDVESLLDGSAEGDDQYEADGYADEAEEVEGQEQQEEDRTPAPSSASQQVRPIPQVQLSDGPAFTAEEEDAYNDLMLRGEYAKAQMFVTRKTEQWRQQRDQVANSVWAQQVRNLRIEYADLMREYGEDFAEAALSLPPQAKATPGTAEQLLDFVIGKVTRGRAKAGTNGQQRSVPGKQATMPQGVDRKPAPQPAAPRKPIPQQDRMPRAGNVRPAKPVQSDLRSQVRSALNNVYPNITDDELDTLLAQDRGPRGRSLNY